MIPRWLAELCAGVGPEVNELVVEAWHIPPDPDGLSGPAPLWGPCNAFWVYVRFRGGDPDRAAWQFVAVRLLDDGPILRVIGEALVAKMNGTGAFILGAPA